MKNADHDLTQRFNEGIDCFTERHLSFKNRIAVALLVATFHAIFAGIEQAAFWIAAVFMFQGLEVFYGKRYLERCLTPNLRILTTYRILCFTATLVYSLIIPFIWFGWGEAGPMFSILALAGAIIHAVLTQSASRQLLIYTIIPHAMWLTILPLLQVTITSDKKPLSILAIGAVIALFIHHAFHAAAIHRRSLNQHKENENRERSLRQRSQELIEEKTALIRTFSHEIRTPLNGIIGSLELLAQNATLDDNATTEVNICRQSAFDLHHIAAKRLDAFSADNSLENDASKVPTLNVTTNAEVSPEITFKPSKASIKTAGLSQTNARLHPPPTLKNILIVDDNKTNRHIARRMLDTLNLPSVTCNDGTEAVELANKENFSALLMDIQMPIMDGISATKSIRQASLNKTTPVIAVSANCQDDMRSKFDAVGINAFLEKPYTRPQLKAMLGKFRIHEQGKETMEEQPHLDGAEDETVSALTPVHPLNATSGTPAENMVDLEMLSDLEETLELDGTIEIITMCLEELSELCQEYDDIEANHDDGEKRRIAHKIKGCASSACAQALSAIAASIEEADAATLNQSAFGTELKTVFQQTAQVFNERYDLAS